MVETTGGERSVPISPEEIERIKAQGVLEARKLNGKKGGDATKAKRGPDYYKNIGKKGAETRWKNKQNGGK